VDSVTVTESLSVVVTAARWIWKPDAPLSEQVDLLRQRTHDLQDGLMTLRNDHAARIEGVQRDVTAQLDRQRETIDQQAHEAVENEQRAVRLDQDGLPLIAAGIVLTGLPDVWLTPIVAGLLLAGSVLLCLRWARRAHRSRETEVHP
jgi:Flp pilus assembly protein TadB